MANSNNIYHSSSLDDKFLKQLRSELEKYFKGCKRIAVKMHFGEVGNTKAFTSKDIKPLTDLLTEMGFDYFLYDSSVAYPGPRSNTVTHKALALAKGFRNVETGDEFVTIAGKYMAYEVCKRLADADAVLVLTHFKGHVCPGFGGAIKNLGMGALTKKTKSDIHSGGRPLFNNNCLKCGACVKCCPISGLVLGPKDSHPVIKNCYGCSNCFYTCPHGAISVNLMPFDILLAEGAACAQSEFKNYYYVSAVKNIAQKCDCEPIPGAIIAKDQGWLMGHDAVAIDRAAYDLIVKKDGEVFLKHNKKKGIQQLDAAEKFGMGKQKYSLKEL